MSVSMPHRSARVETGFGEDLRFHDRFAPE